MRQAYGCAKGRVTLHVERARHVDRSNGHESKVIVNREGGKLLQGIDEKGVAIIPAGPVFEMWIGCTATENKQEIQHQAKQ
jgi:hypothetical protein